MKTLNNYINERLSTNKDKILLTPKSKDELVSAILDHFNKGIGDLNDIDVSELKKEDFYRLFNYLRDEIKKNNITEINISNWDLKELYCELQNANIIGMFRKCEKLETIILPNELEVIGNLTFFNCFNLNNIIIPGSVTVIGAGAFYCCRGIQSVFIPNSVKFISNYAFHCCSSLTSITIPNSVKDIGKYAFYGCNKLTITVPNVRVERLVLDSGFNGEIIIKK